MIASLGLFGRWRWAAIAATAATLAVLLALAPLAVASPEAQRLDERLEPPSIGHPLGTDQLGRDLLSRVLHGARRSFVVGAAVAAIAGASGGAVGLLGGYTGGRFDLVTQRIVDALMALPLLVLALAIVASLGQSTVAVVLSLAIAFAPLPARVARAAALSLRGEGYVEAAVAIGASPTAILIRHVTRNAAGPWLIVVSAQVGAAILAEASLSFLGLGGGRGASLGAMLAGEVQIYMHVAPWLAAFPGLALALVVLGANLLGDGLDSALRPAARRPAREQAI